jgi:hypothetical protein
LCGKEFLEAIQACVPKRFVMQDPLGHIAQGLRGQLQSVFAAAARAADKTCAFEDSNVFAEAGQRHGKRFGNVGYASGATRKPVDDGAPGRIGNGGGDTIEVRGRMVNHMVHYSRDPFTLSTVQILAGAGASEENTSLMVQAGERGKRAKCLASESGNDVRDGVVESSFAVEVGLPESFEEFEVIVPAALIESFPEGVGSVFALTSIGVFRVDHGFDDFAGGVKNQCVPQVARNGFVALAAFSIDGQLHGLSDASWNKTSSAELP